MKCSIDFYADACPLISVLLTDGQTKNLRRLLRDDGIRTVSADKVRAKSGKTAGRCAGKGIVIFAEGMASAKQGQKDYSPCFT